jgi:hypothetical protein
MAAVLLVTNGIALVVSVSAHVLAERQPDPFSGPLLNVKAVGLLLFLLTWPFASGAALGAQPDSRFARVSLWLYLGVTGALFLWILVSLIANVFAA